MQEVNREINKAILVRRAVSSKVSDLWNLPPDDAWESKGACFLWLALACATPFVACGVFIKETIHPAHPGPR